MADPMPELRAALADIDPELILYDGFDAAIVGCATRFGMERVLVYDLAVVRRLLSEDGGTWGEIEDHLGFNVLGLWAGDRTPIFIDTLAALDIDDSKVKAVRKQLELLPWPLEGEDD